MDLKKIPHHPGVYLFQNSRGKVIYVGKAVDLRNRVSSYFSSGTRKATRKSENQEGNFQPNPRLLPRTKLLVENIASFEVVKVESEIEALILEANLIKKHRPYYNVRLKDDKDFLYIKITKEEYPSVQLARTKDLPGTKKYFGPFPDSRAARTTYKLLRKIFPYRTCTPGVGKACFYYHIGLCLGPCLGVINPRDYNRMIRRLIYFLEGKKDQVVRELTYDMNNAARKLEFERAGVLKRQIDSIVYVTTQTTLISRYMENPNLLDDLRDQALSELAVSLGLSGRHLTRIEAYDNSNIQGTFAVSSMVVFTRGEPDKSQYRRFKIRTVKGVDDYKMMKEVLTRRFKRLTLGSGISFHKLDRKFMDVNADQSFEAAPDLIVVDGGRGQLSAAQQVLAELNLPLPVIGLAKRLEEIYLPGNPVPLRLSKNSPALKTIQYLRDEAHRFALAYHRKLRNKALIPAS